MIDYRWLSEVAVVILVFLMLIHYLFLVCTRTSTVAFDRNRARSFVFHALHIGYRACEPAIWGCCSLKKKIKMTIFS